MKPKTRCVHCRRLFIANPRVKNQEYCSRDICQRTRKRRWQQRKMATDADYRQNQKDSRKMWQTQHPGYWQKYRDSHPQYRERNRMLQKQREAKRRAKHLAKMDASTQKINVIPVGYQDFCVSCKKGLDRPPDTVAVKGSCEGGAPLLSKKSFILIVCAKSAALLPLSNIISCGSDFGIRSGNMNCCFA